VGRIDALQELNAESYSSGRCRPVGCISAGNSNCKERGWSRCNFAGTDLRNSDFEFGRYVGCQSAGSQFSRGARFRSVEFDDADLTDG